MEELLILLAVHYREASEREFFRDRALSELYKTFSEDLLAEVLDE